MQVQKQDPFVRWEEFFDAHVTNLLCFQILSTVLLGLDAAQGAVLPPPWANPKLNPCANQPGGWQLLYWPPDGKCYKIFKVGTENEMGSR
jgi:hypothetical protein